MLPRDHGLDLTHQRLGEGVVNFVTSKLGAETRKEERDALQSQILDALQKDAKDSLELDMGQNILVSQTVGESVTETIISSLRFIKMRDREERIPEAHQQTFHWIFNGGGNVKANWKDLKSFLLGEDKLYWVTGKAGSGKSTLMKYIARPAKLYLQSWSKERQLVTASFYFWNSGDEIQTTQEGLLKALLAQIFDQCPELVPLACPDAWEALCLFGTGMNAWKESDLKVALLRCVKYAEKLQIAIALFIDGLDEFEGQPEVLIPFLQDIYRSPNVKCVVASRPWVEFEDTWRHQPSLRVEDLTRDDITRYITSRFLAEDTFEQLRVREEDFANQLIENIVSKAAGVFLWVNLVVTDLINGMRAGDRVSDLNATLELLPSELAQLYGNMLLRLKGKYLHHAAELFSLVKTGFRPMNLLLAHYVDDGDTIFALGSDMTAISEERATSIMDAMQRRINSRCRGLLEATNSEYYSRWTDAKCWNGLNRTVQYLHRTVKDYIEGPEAQKILQPALDSNFDPDLRHLLGHVAYLKSVGWREKLSMLDLWVRHFQPCLKHASRVSTAHATDVIALVDEVKGIGESLQFSANMVRYHDLEDFGFPKVWAIADRHLFTPHFISLAIHYGVLQYVQKKVQHGCVMELQITEKSPQNKKPRKSTRTVLWPLLFDAMFPFAHLAKPQCVKNDMIKCLLRLGANPNDIAPALDFSELELTNSSPLSRSICRLLEVLADHHYFNSTWNDDFISQLNETHLLLRGGTVGQSSVDMALRERWEKLVKNHRNRDENIWTALVRYRLKRQLLSALRRLAKIDDLSVSIASSRGVEGKVKPSYLTTLIEEISTSGQKVADLARA